MANDQYGLPSLVVVIVLGGLLYKWLSAPTSPSSSGSGARAGRGDSASQMRQREAAVERIQQMFPQYDRRTILWDLQRNGGSVAATTEKILSGRMETPPVTFQPPPPPGSSAAASTATTASSSAVNVAENPPQPNLIQRYNLQDKVQQPHDNGGVDGSNSQASSAGTDKKWSTNKDERQSLLQRRRDEMILAARRKLEAKIAAEKAANAS